METALLRLHPAGRLTVLIRSNTARLPQKDPDQPRSSERWGGSEQPLPAALTSFYLVGVCTLNPPVHTEARTDYARKQSIYNKVSAQKRALKHTFNRTPERKPDVLETRLKLYASPVHIRL